MKKTIRILMREIIHLWIHKNHLDFNIEYLEHKQEIVAKRFIYVIFFVHNLFSWLKKKGRIDKESIDMHSGESFNFVKKHQN